MTHRVVGPLALAKNEAGKVLYLYEGAPVPDSVPADEVARLVEMGLVAAVAEPAPAEPEDPTEPVDDPAAGSRAKK